MHILKYYCQLLKFRLSFTVVFSAAIGYLLGTTNFQLSEFILLIIGGFFVTGSANGLNQILERDYDKLMERTSSRPLPSSNLSVIQSLIFSIIIGSVGLYCLNSIHPNTGFFGVISKSSFFGFISIFLYVFSYTPLKRLSTISIFVGAIPGAIPFLLGWVAATDDFGIAAGTLFAIQFFWQFPHFIAIAWVLDKDYKRAGFKMMFGGKKGKYPAMISIVNSLLLTFISISPFMYNLGNLKLSLFALFPVLLLGLWFTKKSYNLYKFIDDDSAKKLMMASFIYLPLMQIIYVLDKYLF